MVKALSSIRSKLVAAFSFIFVLMLALGGASLYGVQELSGKTEYISAHLLPSLNVASTLRGDVYNTRVAILSRLVASSEEERAKQAENVKSQMTLIDEGIETYRPLITTDEERDAMALMEHSWNGFKSGVDDLLRLSNTELALGYYDTEIMPLASNVNDAAEILVALASIRSDEARVEAQHTRDLTIMMVGGALGLAALATIISGVLITFSISRGIGRILDPMKKLAAGDLEVEVPMVGEKTELGQIADALDVFKQNMIEADRLQGDQAAGRERLAENAKRMASLQGEIASIVSAGIEGDFSRRIDIDFGNEELNQLAGSVNNLVETVDHGISETGTVLSALAEADLTVRMEGDYQGAFAKLQSDTNAVADKLADIVGQLRDTSRALKNATGEILSGANDLSERTTKQAATIEETSAAMDQLATTVMDNARKAEDASTQADAVSKSAESGGQVMNEATHAMERITSSSSKISNIIGMIDDIAFQTNLLALNASVEAARAGEAGKGFAVVAVEVRRLAQSAAQASSEVKALIEQSAQEVSGGSRLVADAASKLLNVLEAIKQNNVLLDGIARASREQASSIEEVNAAVRQMDEMTQHNAALVEEINAAIEQTETQAGDLDRVVDIFTLEDKIAAPQRNAEAAPAQPAATGIKGLQERVKSAARSYLSQGNAAVKEDWSEF